MDDKSYEQARERVAVPSAEELADDIEWHWFSPYEMASAVCASVDAPVMKVASAIDAFLREHGQRPAPTSERVSVPSREEIAAGLSTAYQASELNADEALEFDDIPEDERQRHLWMADYVLTLLRQAPTIERVAFEVTDREWMAAGYNNPRGSGLECAQSLKELAQLNRILAQRPAPSAQPWTREPCQKFLVSSAPVPADAERPCQPGVVHFGPISPVASAQGCDPPDTLSALVLRKKLEPRIAELERDLAAERAAHQATKADCERRMNDWQDTHEQEVERLKDDLAAERAALQKARDAIHKIADAFGLVDWSDCGRYVQADDSLIVGEAQTLSKRLATSENARTEVDQLVSLARGEDPSIDNSDSWLSEMAEQFEYDLDKNYPRQIKMQLEQLTDDYTAANTDRKAAEKRAAELERERDEVQATLANLADHLDVSEARAEFERLKAEREAERSAVAGLAAEVAKVSQGARSWDGAYWSRSAAHFAQQLEDALARLGFDHTGRHIGAADKEGK